MTGRRRALAFAGGALVCALVSAALAGSGTGAAAGDGELRSVLVTTETLARGEPIAGAQGLTERRVPAAFVPPDALSAVAEALGLAPAHTLPAGSYVVASALRPPEPDEPAVDPGRGTTPVEIAVTGAGALAQGARGGEPLVDVVVAGEPGPGPGAGRTYVAARRVALLALEPAPDETGMAQDRHLATLALERAEALRLIRVEGIARSIRLLAR